jgi:hypothetical protein
MVGAAQSVYLTTQVLNPSMQRLGQGEHHGLGGGTGKLHTALVLLPTHFEARVWEGLQ